MLGEGGWEPIDLILEEGRGVRGGVVERRCIGRVGRWWGDVLVQGVWDGGAADADCDMGIGEAKAAVGDAGLGGEGAEGQEGGDANEGAGDGENGGAHAGLSATGSCSNHEEGGSVMAEVAPGGVKSLALPGEGTVFGKVGEGGREAVWGDAEATPSRGEIMEGGG